MKRPLALFSIVLVVAACAPSPAATQAPAAQPTALPSRATRAAVVLPTTAPAQAPAAQPTLKPLATAQPEFKPPVSGGVVNPPTLIPTLPGNSLVTSGQQPPTSTWKLYRDEVTGVTFQYPRDWQHSIAGNNKSTLASFVLVHANQPVTNTASIVIDVRKKQGDLLTWLGQQLPSGRLLIDAKSLEDAQSYQSYNAQLADKPAIFLYAPAHGKIAAVAELHTGDNQYFYQVTYLGNTPDSPADRAIFLRLLNTLTLTGTLSNGVTLPTTTFSNGVDPAKWK